MSEMLFDTSAEEPTKKKSRKRPPQEKPVAASPQQREYPQEARYLASIEDHVTCEECGLHIVDLVEVRHIAGQERWLVQCGWNCLTSWLIDPIPGILDQEDANQRDEFVVRGGRFDGMTFSQMDAAGHRTHIRALVEKGRTHVAAAAAEWLTKNGG